MRLPSRLHTHRWYVPVGRRLARDLQEQIFTENFYFFLPNYLSVSYAPLICGLSENRRRAATGSKHESISLTSGVTEVFSTGNAFAALKSDGPVVTWGESGYGGDSRFVD
jgi:hypothetical protein